MPVATSPAMQRLFPGAPAAPLDEVAGIRIDHFVIEGRIGSGGMGTVFLAHDERLQRPVALKVLAPHQTADPGSVQRFQNEARSAARLDHDHIARVFFYGEDQGLHYIAYEFVQGTNLREMIRVRGRLDPAEVVSYGVQLAAALCHTSANGVVHRDIKPSNIIVTPQGKAKLVDLGLARKESLEESAQLTVAGTTLGTFDYISPEQAKDPRGVDVRSDIYSLGCTLYHALTGEPPYPEGTVLQRLLDHQDKPPPDPAAKNRRVPPAFSGVIRKMMAGDPRRRYASAEDLLRDLLIIANTMGLRGVAADATLPALWPALPSRNRIQLVGWGLTAVVMVAAVVALNLHPDLLQSLSGEAGGPAAKSPAAQPIEVADAASTPADRQTAAVKPPADDVASAVSAANSAYESAATRTADAIPPAPANVAVDNQPTVSTTAPRTNGDVEPPTPPRNTGAATAATDVVPRSPIERSPTERTPLDTPRPPRTPTGDGAAERIAPFVIAGSGKSFESLDAACAEIREQGIIELNFDGKLHAAQRPLRLINKRLTIQAAKGRQPVLWFAPREPVADANQSRMIFVAGGSLTLINIGLELETPDLSTTDLWALVSCTRPERLRLQGVTATVVNPRRHAAALVELAAPVGEAFSTMGLMKEGMPVTPVEILVDRCVLRGDGSGFRIRDITHIRCEFEQSLFALGEWLVQAEVPQLSMTAAGRMSVKLEHTTCLLGNGLYSSTGGDDPTRRAMLVEFVSRNNIFSSAASQPLLDLALPSDQMDLHKAVSWTGERNFFDDWDQFWVAHATDGGGVQQLDFQGWCSVWGMGEAVGSKNDPVIWQRPWRERPWSELTPADAQLDRDQPTNPPRSAAADGRDAGAQLDQLPGA
jgi:serine/threonine-protein kinase